MAGRSTWIKHHKDRTLLIPPGVRLEAAQRLRDEPGDVLVEDVSDYIADSIEAQKTIVEETQQRVEAERRTACQVKAARIWARLDDNNGSNSPATIQALWNFATGGTQIHEAFLEQIAGSANLDDRLGTGIVNLARALGVRPHAREI